MIYKSAGIFLMVCSSSLSKAQLIDNSSTFRNIQKSSYFRFHYDNDYFTKSDEYYSQGITLDFVHPSIKKFLPAKLLWKPFKTTPQYGVTFNLFGYTPTSILSDTILRGDRPFNANISLKTFLIQSDSIHQQQVSAAFSFGILGPAALGNEIQTNIHRWTKNPLPHGWQYQIKNDLILNYQVNYEKKLFTAGKHFLLNKTAELRLGTLNNKLSTGFNLMAGRFNKRFTTTNNHKKSEIYFYTQSRVNFIGTDASLQGGLFNRKSPYTISGSNLTRVTYQADAGIIMNLPKFYLSYTQSYLTKEFVTGHYHRWGGISMGFPL